MPTYAGQMFVDEWGHKAAPAVQPAPKAQPPGISPTETLGGVSVGQAIEITDNYKVPPTGGGSTGTSATPATGSVVGTTTGQRVLTARSTSKEPTLTTIPTTSKSFTVRTINRTNAPILIEFMSGPFKGERRLIAPGQEIPAGTRTITLRETEKQIASYGDPMTWAKLFVTKDIPGMALGTAKLLKDLAVMSRDVQQDRPGAALALAKKDGIGIAKGQWSMMTNTKDPFGMAFAWGTLLKGGADFAGSKAAARLASEEKGALGGRTTEEWEADLTHAKAQRNPNTDRSTYKYQRWETAQKQKIADLEMSVVASKADDLYTRTKARQRFQEQEAMREAADRISSNKPPKAEIGKTPAPKHGPSDKTLIAASTAANLKYLPEAERALKQYNLSRGTVANPATQEIEQLLKETATHSKRAGWIAEDLAKKLGHADHIADAIRKAFSVHDIGKMYDEATRSAVFHLGAAADWAHPTDPSISGATAFRLQLEAHVENTLKALDHLGEHDWITRLIAEQHHWWADPIKKAENDRPGRISDELPRERYTAQAMQTPHEIGQLAKVVDVYESMTTVRKYQIEQDEAGELRGIMSIKDVNEREQALSDRALRIMGFMAKDGEINAHMYGQLQEIISNTPHWWRH